MAEEQETGADTDDVWRLKKLCAAKDGQVEALSMRVEVLADDLHEARQELEYTQKQALQLSEMLATTQVYPHSWHGLVVAS